MQHKLYVLAHVCQTIFLVSVGFGRNWLLPLHMPPTIAERIRALRDERKWSKSELGRRLGVRNGRFAVHRYEAGDVVPGPRVLEKLAEAFGVPVADIDQLGSASKGSGRRPKSHGIDNNVALGKIPSSPPTTTPTEGLMRDQVDRLKGALLQIPEEHRERFTRQVSLMQAKFLLELEEPGAMPGKRARVAGKG